MWYALICKDAPGSLEKRARARDAHLARLRALQESGRLLIAGPFPAVDCPDPGDAGFTGSLIVAEFDSVEDARVWADEDPYRAAGVYSETDVRPFNPVLR